MSFPSKFPTHDCKKCGITIKKDDPVQKVPAGNWCKNPQCPNPPGTEAAAAPAVEAPKADLPISATIRNFARDEINKLKIIEEAVKSDLGPNENGQRIGMFVKEIYRTYTSCFGGNQN